MTVFSVLAHFHTSIGIHLDCCCCQVTSVVFNSVRPHRRQPTRVCRPRDSPGKNTGVGCHFKALIFYSASYKIICSSPGSLRISPFPSFFPLPSIFVLNPLFPLSIPPISLLENYSFSTVINLALVCQRNMENSGQIFSLALNLNPWGGGGK